MLAGDTDDRRPARVAGMMRPGDTYQWGHPVGDVMLRPAEGGGELVLRLAATDRMRDAVVVARIEAVHRVLGRASVPHALTVRSVERAEDGRILVKYRAVRGEALVDVLRRGPLPMRRALAVLRRVCRSLTAAHALGIEHRMLGPASVVLLRADDPRCIGLLDYGIASFYRDQSPSACAELQPLTPERVVGGGSGRSEDVYLVGCLAYWLLVGHPPFRGEDVATLRRRHAIEDAPRLDTLAIDHLSDHIVAAVARALEKDPDDRFATVAELEVALDARPVLDVQAVVHDRVEAGACPAVRGHGNRRPVHPAVIVRSGERHVELACPLATEMQGPVAAPVPMEPVTGSAPEPTAIAPQRRRLATSQALAIPVPPSSRHHATPRAIATTALCTLLALAVAAVGGHEPHRATLEPMLAAPFVGRAAGREEVRTARPARANAGFDAPVATEGTAAAPIDPELDVAALRRVPASSERAPSTPRAARPEGDSGRKRMPPDANARPSAPLVDSPTRECDLLQRAAIDARQAHDWDGVLRHTSRGSCWEVADDRLVLRVKALMELGRFDDCAKLGARIARATPAVTQWLHVCNKRRLPPT